MGRFLPVIALLTFLAAGTAHADGDQSACAGVKIRPADADKINAIIEAHAGGTTFCFEPGTYRIKGTMRSKSGDKLICKSARRCILDGGNKTALGLETAYQAKADQLIKGFLVRNFTKVGIHVRPHARAEGNEVTGCEVGMHVNDTIVGNIIHHNRRYGVVGGPARDMLIEGNEIAYNNTARHDPLHDAGGTKIVGAKQGATVIWRANRVHHNYGNGIWVDGNVTSALYEGNLVHDNTGSGIFHEISWSAVIRNNTVTNNNLAQKNGNRGCWFGGQIVLNNSQGVDIFGNTVTAEGTNGICLINANRTDERQNPTALADVNVHDNTIKMRAPAKTGVVGDTAPSGITFGANTYYVDDQEGAFWEGRTAMTRSEWLASGHDGGGVFIPW